MAYPNFGKNKTIVLPLPDKVGGMSLDEYKNKYGIDLKDFLYLEEEDGYINFNANNSLILINTSTNKDVSVLEGIINYIIPVSDVFFDAWVEGSSDGRLTIGVYNRGEEIVFGLLFKVSKSDEFSIDNIKVLPNGV